MMFKNQNVRQLFVNSNGTYNTSDNCDPCIASGIFFQELEQDLNQDSDMIDLYQKTKNESENCGYQVLLDLAGVE